MHRVDLSPLSTAPFAEVLDRDDCERLEQALQRVRSLVGDRCLWHVNSTERGGGVAEILSTLLPYEVGAHVPVGWLVIDAHDGFFDLTKRLHNWLHDVDGDGGELGAEERATYDVALAPELEALVRAMSPGDLAVLHDPQTAGLVRPLRRMGVHVAWRCHVGADDRGLLVRAAWDFLRDDVRAAEAVVFSRAAHVWDGLPPEQVVVTPPCIDILSPKNHDLDDATVSAILTRCGLVKAGSSRYGGRCSRDAERVVHQAGVVEDGPIPTDARLVAQVSRWDRLKDPAGLIGAFVDHGPSDTDVHLLVAGPHIDAVDDDPEGAEVFEAIRESWSALPAPDRSRVHLANLPMDDIEENALIVNALQRRADIVVQKSLAEGFGLTVAEAMWKSRPVIASRVGGIQDQVVHGESGILIDDPEDLAACGKAIAALLDDPDEAVRVGRAARARVSEHFLPVHHFAAEADLLGRLT